MRERRLADQGSVEAASALQTSATPSELVVAPEAALEDGALMRTLRPRQDVAVSLQPLFLGAPAFGDGSLAYLSLTKALEVAMPTWNQAIVTLERDSDTLWPTLAAAHADQVKSLQPEGRYLLGGHSLGGLLAFETAICLERARRKSVGAVILLDSSHPQQFKVEWLEKPLDAVDTTKQHDEKEHALRQLMVMMKAVNFDFDDVHWKALKIDEKFKVFEDLSFQVRPD
jgi:thioesterase domain-containing protein